MYGIRYTVLLGGPVTHLYENLTGNDWSVHGESKYCCYSIYRRWIDDDDDNDNEDDDGSNKVATTTLRPRWEPLVVNQTVHVDHNKDSDDDDDNEQDTPNGNKVKKFAWD